jgi:benzil reductase ((S)-benzoin forming)
MALPLALVTGTSRGVGAATALELAQRGFEVLGAARGRAGLEHKSYRHLALDLSDAGAVESTFGELFERGLLDHRPRIAVVHNAAQLDVEPLHELDLEGAARTLLLNAAVPAWLSGRVLRDAPTTAVLRLVEVSSGAATSALAGWGSYCASKAALRMYGAVLAEELRALAVHRGRDVAHWCYAPGVVDTDMQAQLRAADPERFPGRPRFLELHATDRLAPPTAPAREIADWIEADGHPPWSEGRLRGR